MEMKIKSNFFKGILCGVLQRVIKKKLGYSVELKVKEIEITTGEDGTSTIHLNATGSMKEEELAKIISKLGL